jgi:hypothetical protein
LTSSCSTCPSLHSDDLPDNVLFDTGSRLDLDPLRVDQLVQELAVLLTQLLHQVVDVGLVTIVERLELLIKVVELVSLLNGSIQHVHGHMQVKCVVHIILAILLIFIILIFLAFIIALRFFFIVLDKTESAVVIITVTLIIIFLFRVMLFGGALMTLLTFLAIILFHLVIVLLLAFFLTCIFICIVLVITIVATLAILVVLDSDLLLGSLFEGVLFLLLEFLEHLDGLLDDLEHVMHHAGGQLRGIDGRSESNDEDLLLVVVLEGLRHLVLQKLREELVHERALFQESQGTCRVVGHGCEKD